MKAYKLLKTKKSKPGKLFPLYVMTTKEIPIGEWIEAEYGAMTLNGKVKSKLGEICFRPGWHMSEMPLALHIGIKEDGVIRYMHDDEVWCECEYSDEFDYQEVADNRGWHGDKFVERDAYLRAIPVRGYYRFKTSPLMFGRWIIAGAMKINRVLTDEEVAEICRANSVEPMERRFPFDYSVFGIQKG